MFLFSLESKPSSSILRHLVLLSLVIFFIVPIVSDLKFYRSSHIGVARVVGEHTYKSTKKYITAPIVDLQTELYKVKNYKMMFSGASKDYRSYVQNHNQLQIRFTVDSKGQIDDIKIDTFHTLWSIGLYSLLLSLFFSVFLCLDKDGHYWIKYLILKKWGKVQLAQIVRIEQKVHADSNVYLPTVLDVRLPLSEKIYKSVLFDSKKGHPFKMNQMIEVVVCKVGSGFYLVKLH